MIPKISPTTVTSDPTNKMTNTFPETSENSPPIRRPITVPVIVNFNTVFKRFGFAEEFIEARWGAKRIWENPT
jgi:hypothetical protein